MRMDARPSALRLTLTHRRRGGPFVGVSFWMVLEETISGEFPLRSAMSTPWIERGKPLSMALAGDVPQQEHYYLTYSRRLGAQKHCASGRQNDGIRFAVWAPMHRRSKW